MTAEICIMNKVGVGLAADSAMTLGNGKIYTSAEKLFQLSNKDPVGIMIYQCDSFLGVPWETVIKSFRNNLGDKSLDTVEDYANCFLDYLTSNAMFTRDAALDELGYKAHFFADDFVKGVITRVQDLFKEMGILTTEETEEFRKSAAAIPLEELNELQSLISESNSFETFELDTEEVKREYYSTANDIIKEGLATLQLPDSIVDRVVQLFFDHLFCAASLEFGSYSGVVFSGFGSTEHFPTTLHFVLSGRYLDGLVFRKEVTNIGPRENISAVLPFAQTDMPMLFMNGVDTSMKLGMDNLLEQTVYSLFDEFVELTKNGASKRFAAKIGTWAKNRDKVIQRHVANCDRLINRFSDPIIRIVASLPKDELGAMAETLVNITKFKRRVSSQAETVGGPIDVAIITKGDGFIWYKRKHYFHKDNNLAYMNRRFDHD